MKLSTVINADRSLLVRQVLLVHFFLIEGSTVVVALFLVKTSRLHGLIAFSALTMIL